MRRELCCRLFTEDLVPSGALASAPFTTYTAWRAITNMSTSTRRNQVQAANFLFFLNPILSIKRLEEKKNINNKKKMMKKK